MRKTIEELRDTMAFTASINGEYLMLKSQDRDTLIVIGDGQVRVYHKGERVSRDTITGDMLLVVSQIESIVS